MSSHAQGQVKMSKGGHDSWRYLLQLVSRSQVYPYLHRLSLEYVTVVLVATAWLVLVNVLPPCDWSS